MLRNRRLSITPRSPDGTRQTAAEITLVHCLQRARAVLATTLFAALASFGPAAAQENENYKIAQGLGVYLGVLPAGMVRGPEAGMHGGAPRGEHEYHVIIAVFDAVTGMRVENAKVTATVSGLGHVGQNSLELEPMAIAGTVTYGDFVNLPGNDRYDIAVDIRIPRRNAPVRVAFTYQHLQ